MCKSNSYSVVKPNVKCLICEVGTDIVKSELEGITYQFKPTAPKMAPEDCPSAPIMTRYQSPDLPPTYEEAIKITKNVRFEFSRPK